MNSINAAKQQASFRVTAIPDEIAGQVRLTNKSPQYGHPASISVATGYGPCRSCLKTFETGKDERILFTYNPFEGRAELPLPGPVFIHKNECKRYSGDTFPPDLRALPMLFEAFSKDGEMVKRAEVAENNIEARVEELFAMPETDYLYIRNREAGCFISLVERGKNY